MNYQTFDPEDDLIDIVKCYWTLEGPARDKPQKQRIIPDGCFEMIFHLGDLYKQYLGDDNFITQPWCFVMGQLTHPLEIEPTGATRIFAVRFHPHGFTHFTNMPLKQMENTALPLSDIFGKDGVIIVKKILEAKTTEGRINLIEKFLVERLVNAKNIESIVEATVNAIIELDGQTSINEIPKKMKVHRRQLERKFSSTIGLSPKQLSKVIRLQETLKMLLDRRFENLTELAYEAENFDQAHFIKDFKEFTGLTPNKFYGKHLELSSLFSGPR